MSRVMIHEIVSDRHFTETPPTLVSAAVRLTMEGAHRTDSQGHKVALECTADVHGRGQQRLHVVEDTAVPEKVQDTEINVVSVKKGFQVLPPAADRPPEGSVSQDSRHSKRRSG